MNNLKDFIGNEGINNFQKNGVLFLENIFSKKEIHFYRECCEDILGFDNSNQKFTLADGVTKNEKLWPLIYKKEILNTVKYLINGKIIYTQHSDIHINLGAGAFHRDSREKRFDESYFHSDECVLRVALYIEDKNNNIGGLLVVPSTHRKQSYLQNKELSFHNRIRLMFRKFNLNKYYPQFSLLSNCIKYFPPSGSVVIFDQRVVHAGLAPRNKDGKKYSVFWSYGSESDGTMEHVLFYRKKPSYLPEIPKALVLKLQQNNIRCF